jgi:hypothetical protein
MRTVKAFELDMSRCTLETWQSQQSGEKEVLIHYADKGFTPNEIIEAGLVTSHEEECHLEGSKYGNSMFAAINRHQSRTTVPVRICYIAAVYDVLGIES